MISEDNDKKIGDIVDRWFWQFVFQIAMKGHTCCLNYLFTKNIYVLKTDCPILRFKHQQRKINHSLFNRILYHLKA